MVPEGEAVYEGMEVGDVGVPPHQKVLEEHVIFGQVKLRSMIYKKVFLFVMLY